MREWLNLPIKFKEGSRKMTKCVLSTFCHEITTQMLINVDKTRLDP